MKIQLEQIKIRDVVNGYVNNDADNSVVGFGGKLNIRPKYQREFVYKDKQRDEVINTVKHSFPLNVMYWCKNDDGTFEVLDGQQRTISICEYVSGVFSFEGRYFNNLTDTEQEQILNYELMVYICEGNDREKLDWFKIINIAGEKYLNGSPIRQDYLETAIRWISNDDVEEYMAKHQHEPNANELWLYFQNVINWVQVVFPNYRKEMKGIEWGFYYNEYKSVNYNSKKFEEKIVELMIDDDVSKKSGIYEYLLYGKEKHLNIRAFTDKMKREAYEKHGGWYMC